MCLLRHFCSAYMFSSSSVSSSITVAVGEAAGAFRLVNDFCALFNRGLVGVVSTRILLTSVSLTLEILHGGCTPIFLHCSRVRHPAWFRRRRHVGGVLVCALFCASIADCCQNDVGGSPSYATHHRPLPNNQFFLRDSPCSFISFGEIP